MIDTSGGRGEPHDSYYYRRDLSPRALLPAVGLAIGAALVTFYVARLMLQRTPLDAGARPAPRSRRSLPARSRA